MDTHASALESDQQHYTMALPGEEPGEAVAASAASPGNAPASQGGNSKFASTPDKPAKLSLIRGWWAVTPRRTKLLAGAAILAVGALGGYGLYTSQTNSNFQGVSTEPGYTPNRAVQTQAAAWEQPATTGQTIIPPEPPPQAVLPTPAPIAVASPDPAPAAQIVATTDDPQIADMRRLVREAAIAPTVAPPRADAEKAQMAAMVTALSGITRESLEQQIQLRKQLTQAISDLQAEIADLKQRLTFAEARAGFQAAVGAASSDARGPAPRLASGALPAPQSQRTAGPAPQYRISAASTGMAALVVVNAAPGQTDKVEVFVGDVLPGYGKVLRIEQKGTAWQLIAEQGSVGQ
jgi:hypothetical protein